MPESTQPKTTAAPAPWGPLPAGLRLCVGMVGALTVAGIAWALMPEGEAPPEVTIPVSPLPDWTSVSAAGFGARADSIRAGWLLQENGPGEAEVRAIGEHLDGPAETATRAAVLLGAALDLGQPSSAVAKELLMERLGAKNAPASRAVNGVDIVAAQALGPHLAAGSPEAATLVELATGALPHPDLAVRVECASAALGFAGAWGVAPFLLSVLRAETPGEKKSPRTWPRVQTLAWVKTRAAAALSSAVDTEMRFRPDGSWDHQTGEADRLEALFQGRSR